MAPKMPTNEDTVDQLKKYVLEGVVTHLKESVSEEVAQEFQKVVEAKLASVKARAPATPPAVTTLQPVARPSSSTEMVAVIISNKTGSTLSIMAPDENPAVTSTDGTAAAPTSIKILPLKSVPAKTEASEQHIPVCIPGYCLERKWAQQLNDVIRNPSVTSSFQLPVDIISSVVHQHVNTKFKCYDAVSSKKIQQLDGNHDSTDEEEDDEEEEKPTPKKAKIAQESEEESDDEDDEQSDWSDYEATSIGSDDDIVDDDELLEPFETENVIVCKCKKITKTAEAWTMDLRDVFLTINGRDHFFKKMILTANWWPKKTGTKDD